VTVQARSKTAARAPAGEAHADGAHAAATLAEAEALLGTAWPTSPGDESAARVYLALVRQPKPSRSALAEEGFTAAETDVALLLLQSRGLVGAFDAEGIEVPPPDIAIPRYAAALERQASSTRSAAQGLAHAYRLARAEYSDDLTGVGISVLTTPDDLDRARFEVVSRARQTRIEIFARGAGTQTLVLEQAALLAAATSVADRRAVFDAAYLDVIGALEALGRLLDAGVEVRISQRLPCSAVVVDDAALADVSNMDASGFGSILVRHRPLVRVVRVLAEGIYEASSPLPLSPADASSPSWLDERDRQILVLIAAGATDTMISRQVRISQRTVERRLRAMMDELGATTRFQAGVQAAKRGLV